MAQKTTEHAVSCGPAVIGAAIRVACKLRNHPLVRMSWSIESH